MTSLRYVCDILKLKHFLVDFNLWFRNFFFEMLCWLGVLHYAFIHLAIDLDNGE